MRNIQLFACFLISLSCLETSLAWGGDPPPDAVSETDPEIPAVAPIIQDRVGPGTGGGPGPGGGMGAPGMGPPGYMATWYPSRPASNTFGDLGFVRQNLSGAVPIWKEGGDTVLLMAGVRNTLFSTDVILPDTQRPFPSELWNINFGLMHTHKFENGWSSGLSTTIGSASDKPFHGLREMDYSIFGFLKVPTQNDRDAWMFSIMYSPVGNVAFPIPGIAYSWKPSDDFNMSIGLPFLIKWKPVEDLTLTFSYIPVTNINARATYRVIDEVNIYCGFEWLYEAYFLADRTVQNERFLGFEKRLIGGLRWAIWTHATLDFNAGYSFDRYYGQGTSQISNLHDEVNISPGAFVGANLLVTW